MDLLCSRALCSYTHPALAEGGELAGAKLPRFASLKELRRHLEEHLKLQFCTVCLEGRKVRRRYEQLADTLWTAPKQQLLELLANPLLLSGHQTLELSMYVAAGLYLRADVIHA